MSNKLKEAISRVKKEKAKLDEKIDKLSKFLETVNTSTDSDYYALMVEQKMLMIEYSKVLNSRLVLMYRMLRENYEKFSPVHIFAKFGRTFILDDNGDFIETLQGRLQKIFGEHTLNIEITVTGPDILEAENVCNRVLTNYEPAASQTYFDSVKSVIDELRKGLSKRCELHSALISIFWTYRQQSCGFYANGLEGGMWSTGGLTAEQFNETIKKPLIGEGNTSAP